MPTQATLTLAALNKPASRVKDCRNQPRCPGCKPLDARADGLLRAPQPPAFARRRARAPRAMLVSYAEGEPFVSRQRVYAQTALRHGGVHAVRTWNMRRLNSTAWARNLPLEPFLHRYGPSARWVWKPFVILDALEAVEEGDFVMYADASRHCYTHSAEHELLLHASRARLRSRGVATAAGPNLAGTCGFNASMQPLLDALAADAAGTPATHATRRLLNSTFGMIPGLRLPVRNSACIYWNGMNTHSCHHTKVRRCDLCDVLAKTGLCAAGDERCCARARGLDGIK